MKLEKVKNFLGDGLYLSVERKIGTSFEKHPKENLYVYQEVILNYDITDLFGIDKKVRPEAYNMLMGENLLNFDFSKKYRTGKDIFELIERTAENSYPSNMLGSVSRILELEIDSKSVKIEPKDIVEVRSKKDGEFTLKLFSIRFKAKGMAQWGGYVGINTPDEEYRKKMIWTGKTPPH